MNRLVGSMFAVAAVTLWAAAVTAGGATQFDEQARRCFGCHEETAIKSTPFVHAPVAMNACATCHTAHDGPDTASKLTARGDQLCFGCHDAGDYRGKLEHTRSGDGCAGCHGPHAGQGYSLLRAAAPRLCEGCHANKAGHRRGKRAAADCTRCHDVHAARTAKLLRAAAGKLGACKRDRAVKRPTRIAER